MRYKNGTLRFEANTTEFPKSGYSIKMVFWYLKQLQYNFQNQDTAWKWCFDIWSTNNTISIQKWYFDIWSNYNTISKITLRYKNGILLFEAKTIQFPKSGCSMKMVFFYLKQLQYNFQNRMQHQNGIFLFETII